MLQFLLSVTNTLLAMTIMFGMLLGYAVQKQLWEVRTPAVRGLCAGALIAAILAVLELTTGFVVREYYNLAVLLVAVPGGLLLLALLTQKRTLPSERAATPFLGAMFFLVTMAWAAFYLPNIFLYPSHFAVGTVTVVSTEFVFIVTGYLTGLLLAGFIGYAVFSVSSPLRADMLFPLLASALLVFAAGQGVVILQTLLGRGLLPRYDWLLDLIIFLLSHENVFLFMLLAIGALIAVFLWQRSKAAPVEGDNPAIRRKARSLMRNRIRWSKAVLCGMAVALLTVTVGGHFSNKAVELSPPKEIVATDDTITIPLTMVNDGALHRFIYKSQKGVDVRYIVIKKSESAYGVGLDACDVCGPSGYYQRKGDVVCILCDVVMNIKTIGFAGGCNPVPFKFVIRDGSLIIETKTLEAEAPRFM